MESLIIHWKSFRRSSASIGAQTIAWSWFRCQRPATGTAWCMRHRSVFFWTRRQKSFAERRCLEGADRRSITRVVEKTLATSATQVKSPFGCNLLWKPVASRVGECGTLGLVENAHYWRLRVARRNPCAGIVVCPSPTNCDHRRHYDVPQQEKLAGSNPARRYLFTVGCSRSWLPPRANLHRLLSKSLLRSDQPESNYSFVHPTRRS